MHSQWHFGEDFRERAGMKQLSLQSVREILRPPRGGLRDDSSQVINKDPRLARVVLDTACSMPWS